MAGEVTGGDGRGGEKQIPHFVRDDIRRSGAVLPATVLVFKPRHDPSTARPALAFASGGKNRPLRSG